MKAAYGIFYEPYYTGQGGPLQSPISAPPYLQTPQVNGPQSFANPYLNQNLFTGQFAEPMTILTLAPAPHPALRAGLEPYCAEIVRRRLARAKSDTWEPTGLTLPRFIEGNPTAFIPGRRLQRQSHLERKQRQPASPLFGMHAGPARMAVSTLLSGLIAGIANSSYNALEASLRKRFSHGLSFLASYTWSHSIDDVSSFNITGSASQPVAGENDLGAESLRPRGRARPVDVRRPPSLRAELSVEYFRSGIIPTNWYQHAFGNWQLNGIFDRHERHDPSRSSILPDNSLQGGAPEITGFSANRPNVVGNPNSGPRTPQEWFNVSAFQQLAPDPTGPASRSSATKAATWSKAPAT